MTKYTISPITPEAIDIVAENMSTADEKEAWACGRFSPRKAVEVSMRYCNSPFVGKADDTVLCVGGVGMRALTSDVGVPWMLGTPDLVSHGRGFLRHSKNYVQQMKLKYSRLENFVDNRHTASIRWLEWLGFTLDEPKPYGVDDMLFRRFHMKGAV